jgi:hypothetical protein
MVSNSSRVTVGWLFARKHYCIMLRWLLRERLLQITITRAHNAVLEPYNAYKETVLYIVLDL